MRYWLLEWLERNNINTEQDLALLNFDSKLINSMFKEAEVWSLKPVELSADLDYLFAGTGLSPADFFCCTAYNCGINVIETLFRHAWHYFDKIIIKDFVGYYLLQLSHKLPVNEEETASLLDSLVSGIKLVIFIRSMGGTELLEFIPSVKPDVAAIRKAYDHDSRTLLIADEIISNKLLTEGKFTIKSDDNKTYVEMYHVGLGMHLGINLDRSHRTSIEKIKKQYVKDLMGVIHDSHYADSYFTRVLNASLG